MYFIEIFDQKIYLQWLLVYFFQVEILIVEDFSTLIWKKLGYFIICMGIFSFNQKQK